MLVVLVLVLLMLMFMLVPLQMLRLLLLLQQLLMRIMNKKRCPTYCTVCRGILSRTGRDHFL